MISSPATPLLAVFDDDRFLRHAPLAYHPERAERLIAAREGLAAARTRSTWVELVCDEQLPPVVAEAHGAPYLERLEARLADGHGLLDPDTYFSEGTREAAWVAASGAAALGTWLVQGGARRAFGLPRPPGHHALADRAMGFCLLNNVAIAAHAALAGGASRVAILDWDAHHGNGTQAIFEADPRVLFISIHQYPAYPGTGAPEEVGVGPGRGATINVAMPRGAGPEAYSYAFREVVMPALGRFGPDAVLVSAGFDASLGDPLAQLSLDAATFGAMASAVLAAHDRVGFMLEGGYDLRALQAGVGAVGDAMVGARLELSHEKPRDAQRSAVNRTKEIVDSIHAARSKI